MVSPAEWFASNVLPLEPKLRGWLRRAGWGHEDMEDLIQETYARVAASDIRGIGHVSGYLFATARNVATDQLRRKRIVSIRTVADLSRLNVVDPQMQLEDQLSAHDELARLAAVIERLPSQCRAVIMLRKVEGLSQAETAARLGLSQSTVEKHVARGMRLCAAWMTEAEDDSAVRSRSKHKKLVSDEEPDIHSR